MPDPRPAAQRECGSISQRRPTEEPEMNSFTTNLAVADQLAHRTVQDRVRDAERRAEVRALRTARRAERRTARREASLAGARPPASHREPWWLFRLAHPAR